MWSFVSRNIEDMHNIKVEQHLSACVQNDTIF